MGPLFGHFNQQQLGRGSILNTAEKVILKMRKEGPFARTNLPQHQEIESCQPWFFAVVLLSVGATQPFLFSHLPACLYRTQERELCSVAWLKHGG